MPTDGLFDSYVKIFYHSAYAIHSHTIPTTPLISTGLGDAGSYLNWNGAEIEADVMVKAMMDAMAATVVATTIYDKFTLYKWNATTEVFNPMYEESYSVAGSYVGGTGQAAAVQQTVSIRTLGFSLLKLVFLDRASGGFFGNVYSDGTFADVIAEATNPDNAWSGRDNTRPFSYTNTSISLNKRLRRKYGMI